MGNLVDLTGRRFGRLIVVRFDGYYGEKKYPKWLCRCDCGSVKSYFASNLLYNKSKGCGCRRRDVSKTINLKHGMSNTRLYRIWSNIKDRCYRSKNPFYHRYGGRGIIVCEDWLDFESFAKWALEHGYSEHLSIDRIDNDKGYYPDNCRWVNQYIQSRNTSRNNVITYNNKTMIAADWARSLGVNQTTLDERIEKYGIEKALSMKKHCCPRIGEIEYNGKTMLASGWAELFGVNRATMYKRFRKYGIKKAMEYSFAVKAKKESRYGA
jgi:hypothetical protein